jgi:hypothetical protein
MTSTAAVEKVVIQAERCRPINYALASRNVVMVVFGLTVLLVNLVAYNSIKDHFMLMQAAVHVAPCAVATPSARGILRGIGKAGFAWSPLVVPSTEELATRKITAAVCESENVYMAIASVLDNSTMIHVADTGSYPTTYTDAENDLVENLCNRRDPEGDIFGEIRRRITTAYVLANPAFRRYHTTGCMGNNDPFPTASTACKYSASVAQVELHLAAYDTVIAGYGDLPAVGHMLYRLMLLSVISEHDRRLNDNRCFSNALVKNATELCQEIYDPAHTASNVSGAPPPAAPLSIGVESVYGYEATIHTLASCNSIYAPPMTVSPPPPPPFPNWNFDEPFAKGMGSVDPVVDACRNVHSFGHFDQQSAFGIPDVAHPFSWKPAHWDMPARWMYNAFSHDKMKQVANIKQNPINALKLHNAYRFAVASVAMVLTGVCCGYWIGFGGTPMVAFLLYRYGNIKNKLTGNYSTLLSPRLSYGAYFAVGTTLVVWVYFSILDPWLPSARSYTINPSCSDWHKRSTASVFVTSDYLSGPWEYLVGYLFPIIPVYALVYNFFCRGWGVPSEEWKLQISTIDRIPQQATVFVILQFCTILVFASLAMEDGDMWFDNTIRRDPGSHQKSMSDVDAIISDVAAVITMAILGGFACSITRQRWAFAQIGYRIHLVWFIVVIFCLLLPVLLYVNLSWQHAERTWENVTHAVYLILFTFSVFVAYQHWKTLTLVPGGNPADSNVKENKTVAKSTNGQGWFARLRNAVSLNAAEKDAEAKLKVRRAKPDEARQGFFRRLANRNSYLGSYGTKRPGVDPAPSSTPDSGTEKPTVEERLNRGEYNTTSFASADFEVSIPLLQMRL